MIENLRNLFLMSLASWLIVFGMCAVYEYGATMREQAAFEGRE
jgi:hypothetical protein